jgi:hypothetical protein
VSECDHEASIMRRRWPTRGCCAMKKKTKICFNCVDFVGHVILKWRKEIGPITVCKE